jgi:glycine betaine transporter
MTDVRPDDATPAMAGGPARQFGTVFYVTVGISVAFVLAGILFTEPFGNALAAVVEQIIATLGWLYLLLTTVFLVFVLILAFGRFGRVRLGGPDAEPEFRLVPWFCMLFQAGMGIGLLFWGVAEPLLHYRSPPSSTGRCTRGRSTRWSASRLRTSASTGA